MKHPSHPSLIVQSHQYHQYHQGLLSLRRLEAFNNKLTRVPPELLASPPPELHEINLSGNAIPQLPDAALVAPSDRTSRGRRVVSQLYCREGDPHASSAAASFDVAVSPRQAQAEAQAEALSHALRRLLMAGDAAPSAAAAAAAAAVAGAAAALAVESTLALLSTLERGRFAALETLALTGNPISPDSIRDGGVAVVWGLRVRCDGLVEPPQAIAQLELEVAAVV